MPTTHGAKPGYGSLITKAKACYHHLWAPTLPDPVDNGPEWTGCVVYTWYIRYRMYQVYTTHGTRVRT
ncbi:hypothetical protein Kisp02_26500 [Kineosporia sp. NBRC 101731]|nr:hypothetical protein Kisp02_26500 [Kineosporia sp. NBRC 101731]